MSVNPCLHCKDQACDICNVRPRNKCGKAMEVFSRVCGYYRPIKNWNKGKQEEFKDRKVFKAS